MSQIYTIITGASRGIGLELARQGLEADQTVLGVARAPQNSKGMQELLKEFPESFSVLAVDLQDPEGPHKIAVTVGSWPQVDVLINNAGVFEGEVSVEAFLKSFHVNSVSPLMVTQALLPALQKSKNPKVVQITSRMGSISDNTSGGYYCYRASKAALNMINKSLSVDNKWLTTLVMHPGWVKTDMGGSNAPTEPKDSAAGIWRVIANVKNENSGEFWDYSGRRITW